MDRRCALRFLISTFAAHLAARPVAAEDDPQGAPKRVISIQPDMPVGFGYEIDWMAVKSSDTEAVARHFGVAGSGEAANWQSGLDAVYDREGPFAFVTPPVDGWTLVVSNLHFAQSFGALARVKGVIAAASHKFGECQYFGSYRVVDFAAWHRSVNGRLIRGYAYVGWEGVITANEGAVTAIEQELGFGEITGLSPDEVLDLAYEAEEDPEHAKTRLPNEEDPLRVAAAWSINPMMLGERTDLPPGVGRLISLAFA